MGQKGEKKIGVGSVNWVWSGCCFLNISGMTEGLTLSFVLLGAAEPIRTEGPGNVCKLLVPSSLEFMCWHRTDPFYTQRPARGRRYQAVDGCDRTGGLANQVSASRLGFFPCNLTHFQIQILCKQLRSNRTSFTRQPPGSASPDRKCARPGLVFFFSLFRRL